MKNSGFFLPPIFRFSCANLKKRYVSYLVSPPPKTDFCHTSLKKLSHQTVTPLVTPLLKIALFEPLPYPVFLSVIQICITDKMTQSENLPSE